MYLYKVYVNEEFTDKYTGKLHSVGSTISDLTEERVNEINAVSKTLISVISKTKVPTDEEIAKEKELAELRAKVAEQETQETVEQETKKTTSKKDQNE